jgi:hypothetical protein
MEWRWGADEDLAPVVTENELAMRRKPCGGNKTETSWVGVPGKQFFLPVLAILLNVPLDPHFVF